MCLIHDDLSETFCWTMVFTLIRIKFQSARLRKHSFCFTGSSTTNQPTGILVVGQTCPSSESSEAVMENEQNVEEPTGFPLKMVSSSLIQTQSLSYIHPFWTSRHLSSACILPPNSRLLENNIKLNSVNREMHHHGLSRCASKSSELILRDHGVG